MTIASAIKKYRIDQGLTQAQLADRLSRSTRSVIRYETGQTLPSLELLNKIFVGDQFKKIIPIYIREVLHKHE